MFYRLVTLIIKEMQSLLRDSKTRSILIMPVIIQVLVFPFAATLEVNNAKIAIYSEDNGQAAIELTQRFSTTDAFSQVQLLHNSQQITQVLDNQQALLVIRFPANFSRSLSNQQPASIQVLLDGRHSNSAQIAANYIQQVVQQYLQELHTGEANTVPNLQLVIRNWYNPNLNYKWFVVPSLIAMITTIGILIVTALSIAREREQGTMDQLLVSPLTTSQIFIGKAVPAIIVAYIQATIVLLFGTLIYQIPFAGSLLLFYTSILIYGLSLVGFGLFISTLCATQQQAFIGVFVFIMPAILLSGYISPVENMPIWLQNLTWFNPIRHFTDITKQIYLKDAGFLIIWQNLWPLLFISITTGSIAYILFKKKLK